MRLLSCLVLTLCKASLMRNNDVLGTAAVPTQQQQEQKAGLALQNRRGRCDVLEGEPAALQP